jgi:ppGpp synthetase/RelA/SpoT-type nucleotidyltranferase
MLTYGVTPSECFQASTTATSSTAPSKSATHRFFRNTADPSTEADAAASSSFVWTNNHLWSNNQNSVSPAAAADASSSSPMPALSKLPTWLAQDKESHWESNWETLRSAMLSSSFFTPKETLRLLTAIQSAAQNDRHQMAGAAEFCLILVETMEMGLTALIAAAFHYCSCVTARQRAASSAAEQSHHHHPSHTTASAQQIWDDAFSKTTPDSLEEYGDHATLIAKDAGRLKTLEMVAAMIYSDKAASRVTPDHHDAENLQSLLLTETKDWRALAIRSAAALYRLKGILHHASRSGRGVGARELTELTPEALQTSREALYIYAPLASRLGMHRLKNELEGAAFRILYRRQYEKVNRLARELRPRHSKPHLNRGLVQMCDNSLDISSCMRNVLASVKHDMTQLLQNDEHFQQYVEDFSVTARVKEPYSMWKKMLRNKCQHILEVPDALALRIVLDAKKLSPTEDEEVKRARERALCYYAQKLCMEHWQPVQSDPRFKDYIERPKHNGYQSLHYTAHTMWDHEDWNLEIQVRSGEMHQVAEFGLASHWDYKAQQRLSGESNNDGDEVKISMMNNHNNDQSSDAYLRSVQEWHWQQHAGKTQQAQALSAFSSWILEEEQSAVSSAAASEEEYQDSYEDMNLHYSLRSILPPVQRRPEDTSSSADERADRIRARTKKLQPYIEALTAAQSDLAREHVFVFLTTSSPDTDHHHSNQQPGKVLALPAGACVLDALREGEKHLGLAFPWKEEDGFFALNGKVTSKLTSKLSNGDILTVPRVHHHNVANGSATISA